MADYARVHGFVSGHVQGVGYRYFAQDIAAQYDIQGWVRNVPDGRVEFVAEGRKGMLGDFIKAMQRGPVSGNVSGMDINWENYAGEFSSFRIRF
jgi:acylphosphatase